MRLDTFPKYNITAESLSGASTLSVSLPLEGEGYVPVYCGNDGKLSLKFADITEFANNNSGSSTGGDGSITVDQTFNSASTNAQSGTAVKSAIMALNPDYNNSESLSLGIGAVSNSYAVAVGPGTNCYSFESVAIGYNADANLYGVSNGYSASSNNYGIAIGRSANAGTYGISIGYSSNTVFVGNYYSSIAIGYNSNAYYNSINIGCNNSSVYNSNEFSDGIVIGYNNYPRNSDSSNPISSNSIRNIILGYNNDIPEAKNGIIIGQNNHLCNEYIDDTTNIIIGNNNSAAPYNSIIMIGNNIFAGNRDHGGGGGGHVHTIFSNGYATNNKYYQFYFGLNESYNPILGVIPYDINGNRIDSECYQIDLTSLGTNSYSGTILDINN